jgi:hypothetical protein
MSATLPRPRVRGRLVLPTTAPPPDAEGFWHYTYVTFHPDTMEWYGGKHSTKRLRDGYLGSGNWVRRHRRLRELIVQVVEFFATEGDAFIAEAALVSAEVIRSDLFCRNEGEGGVGPGTWGTTKSARRRAQDPVWRAANAKRLAVVHRDPVAQAKNSAALSRYLSDPDVRRRMSETSKKLHADRAWSAKNEVARAIAQAAPEVRAQMSASARRRAADPEWKRRHGEVMKRHFADPVWRAAYDVRMAKMRMSAEWGAKISNGIKKRGGRKGQGTNVSVLDGLPPAALA